MDPGFCPRHYAICISRVYTDRPLYASNCFALLSGTETRPRPVHCSVFGSSCTRTELRLAELVRPRNCAKLAASTRSSKLPECSNQFNEHLLLLGLNQNHNFFYSIHIEENNTSTKYIAHLINECCRSLGHSGQVK